MATDPNPALRAELKAALDVVTPQVRGMEDFIKGTVTPPVAEAMTEQIVIRSRRRDLILAAIASLDAVQTAMGNLESDGYPGLPNATVLGSVFDEIQEQQKDLDLAAKIFDSPTMAASVNFNLGKANEP